MKKNETFHYKQMSIVPRASKMGEMREKQKEMQALMRIKSEVLQCL